ncbi:DUF6089 family protein [Patiriisocius marinus]|uniref:DUF6089 domain-containing protein n=1 Tax=Patiriisocius marinus TaxID=1397112 RepID=A0A5J4J5A4_9FLAO|nr:DUF6089 family protein [Patiriisocius marinus]GER60991.1 hypothetical protein ULMA_30990 [Patiriisocius marinus]
MKYFVTLLIILTSSFIAQSQTYEIGGFVGGANVIGDVGNTAYINPNTLAVGGIFKWNRSERHSFRFSAIVAQIEGDDNESSETRRQQRGYSYENTISELSVGMEYTFWEFNLNSGNPVSAPYLYTGITYFFYDDAFVTNDGITTRYKQSAGAFAIPIVLGYKTTLGTNFMGAIEIGARYAFTDNIDASNPRDNFDSNEYSAFGNTNNNDWYVFTGITFSFTFGRKPCYCNF